MTYGKNPVNLGIHVVKCTEMMFFQYLPIKLPGQHNVTYEKRLHCFNSIIGSICCDFIGYFGLDRYVSSYVYLTAKHLYQLSGCSFNRPGYHSDGFMTNDINYIWSNRAGTIYNNSIFHLSNDDELSLIDMFNQADPTRDFKLPDNTLSRLDQFVIHKVDDKLSSGMRTFIKVSFSYDKYDMEGNSHNYLIPYNWEMKPRKEKRNIPQSIVQPYTT